MKNYLLLFIFILQSCAENVTQSLCELIFLEKKEFLIDENTYYRSKNIFPFKDETTGKEYLSFENSEKGQQEIIIFDIDTQEIVKRVEVKQDGPNGIAMFGHSPENLNSFYISSPGIRIIYKINDRGDIIQKYDYSATENNEPLTLAVFASIMYHPLIISDSCMYLPQSIFTDVMDGDKWSETPLMAKFDMSTMKVQKMPIKYPRLFEKESLVTSTTNIGYSYDANDDNFVYSFLKSDSIIVTHDHINAKKYLANSRYVKDIKYVHGMSLDILSSQKELAEQGMYWHFVYDKYRDLYYRFVLFPCVVNEKDDVMEVDMVRQEFSVIIMNKDFEIIGETKFPKDKYLPKVFFVGEKGLYISENNPRNPEYDEDKLVFSCFVPEYK